MWKTLGLKKKRELCRGIERNERRKRDWGMRQEKNGEESEGEKREVGWKKKRFKRGGAERGEGARIDRR